ncbi:hypothetical protein IWQ55_001977 [Labrenzia sp. EL_208]|nr:hypothetical protein [Labrenzia sp. EL_132]MBG6228772.1 hypothetical protein [Labrenzia sp. EL_208]
MGLCKSISKFLYEDKRPRSRVSEPDDLVEFIKMLRPKPTSHELVRIGEEGDGGYLVPDDFQGIGFCFSPGVSVKASFEEELASRYSIKSFLGMTVSKTRRCSTSSFRLRRSFWEVGTKEISSGWKVG